MSKFDGNSVCSNPVIACILYVVFKSFNLFECFCLDAMIEVLFPKDSSCTLALQTMPKCFPLLALGSRSNDYRFQAAPSSQVHQGPENKIEKHRVILFGYNSSLQQIMSISDGNSVCSNAANLYVSLCFCCKFFNFF